MAQVIDPNKPTREEVMAHNMKIAKANLACELAKAVVSGPGGIGKSADEIGHLAISIAETIIETYSLMPDNAGVKGGLIS